MPTDKLLTVHEVSDRLGFTTVYVYMLLQEGKLKKTKVGARAVRIAETDLADYIARQNVEESHAQS